MALRPTQLAACSSRWRARDGGFRCALPTLRRLRDGKCNVGRISRRRNAPPPERMRRNFIAPYEMLTFRSAVVARVGWVEQSETRRHLRRETPRASHPWMPGVLRNGRCATLRARWWVFAALYLPYGSLGGGLRLRSHGTARRIRVAYKQMPDASAPGICDGRSTRSARAATSAGLQRELIDLEVATGLRA